MLKTKQTNTKELKSILWNTALYIRLSKEDGNDESLSVKNQKQLLEKYAELHSEEFEVIDIYIDDGCTGTDSNRDNFQRMLADIQSKRVNCVIVKDLSRLSRNYIEAGQYLEYLFAELNVRFISLDLPSLDSYKHPEQMNSILVPMLNVINDDFCRQTSLKIRNVFNMKRSNGDFIGAFAPYGYKKDPNNKSKLIIDEEAAEVVKRIFKWYVSDGIGIQVITYNLNDLGIINPAEYKKQTEKKYSHAKTKTDYTLWNVITIRKMLSNRVYIGDMVQGKEKVKSYKIHKKSLVPENEWFIVENTHEPIIDKNTFKKAQDLLSRYMRTAPGEKKVYPFSGFLRCADCNGGMQRHTSKGFIYYHCRTYTSQSKDKCSKHTIRLEALEKAVLAAIKNQINLCFSLKDIIAEINNAPVVNNQSKHIDALLKTKQKELDNKINILDNLYMDWKIGDISREQYLRMKPKIEEQISGLYTIIENLNREQKIMSDVVTAENPYLTHFLKYENIDKLDRNIITELVDMIYIHENKEITIQFKFADQYQRILEFIENNDKAIMTESITKQTA